MLAALQTGAERGAELVRKLLSFAGGGGGERTPVEAAAMIKEMKGIISHTFPKSVRLNVNLPADLSPLLADATQLSQVLLNLCVNARDAMPNGGTLTVSATNAFVSFDDVSRNPTRDRGEFCAIGDR